MSLALLLRALVDGRTEQGLGLLLAGLQVWLVNGIVFGLACGELDRWPALRATAS